MSFQTIINWETLSEAEQEAVLMRPAVSASDRISAIVTDILKQVKTDGDEAVLALTRRFDDPEISQLEVSQGVFDTAEKAVSSDIKEALDVAVKNLTAFHTAQYPKSIVVETMPGITCQQVTRPVGSVGLYIPGGTAPLFSTALMLLVPAKIAGCQEVILCSPPPIAPEILYACRLCGVERVYQVGGAQAIAAMAFGTQSIPKVDKIFGPGNAFVTEAKRQVSQRLDGAAIDMPAGPSEVLVVADAGANAQFVAADLLSQAEHGADSQVVLLTDSADFATRVGEEVQKQLALLPRAEIARKALSSSRLIVADSIETCIAISNRYAPEHLILETRNATDLTDQIMNAGSVFVGDYSPESVGDYASGTNHVLPTYGYAKTYSSLGLADFQKRMTIQTLTPAGLKGIGAFVEKMAAAERLDAHKNAVSVRLSTIKGLRGGDDGF